MEDTHLMDSSGRNIQLNTFHGDDAWVASTNQAVIDDILKSTASFGQPFLLELPSIADKEEADVWIEVPPGVVQHLEKLALEAAWGYITNSVFQKICPNFIEDPAAVIQEIMQHQTDPAMMGGQITLIPLSNFIALFSTVLISSLRRERGR
eukprot:scaffold59128_cov55-Attheya_sp.AAC.1